MLATEREPPSPYESSQALGAAGCRERCSCRLRRIDFSRTRRGGHDEETGLLRDPELGNLTSSGPDDPSHQAYALVLVGDFAKAPMDRGQIGPSPSPLPPIRWVFFIVTLGHADAGVSGYGRGDFDAAQYPSLQPFHF